MPSLKGSGGGFAELGYSIGAFTPYVRPEYIRLSVGLEDVEDIKEDLAQALAASQQ